MASFVSWYRAPGLDRPIEYLALMPATDYDDGGFFYTQIRGNAHRFDTLEAAQAATPVYDGSHGIEGRTGVITVFDLAEPEIDPNAVPGWLWAFIALFAAYFFWQFFIR